MLRLARPVKMCNLEPARRTRGALFPSHELLLNSTPTIDNMESGQGGPRPGLCKRDECVDCCTLWGGVIPLKRSELRRALCAPIPSNTEEAGSCFRVVVPIKKNAAYKKQQGLKALPANIDRADVDEVSRDIGIRGCLAAVLSDGRAAHRKRGLRKEFPGNGQVVDPAEGATSRFTCDTRKGKQILATLREEGCRSKRLLHPVLVFCKCYGLVHTQNKLASRLPVPTAVNKAGS